MRGIQSRSAEGGKQSTESRREGTVEPRLRGGGDEQDPLSNRAFMSSAGDGALEENRLPAAPRQSHSFCGRACGRTWLIRIARTGQDPRSRARRIRHQYFALESGARPAKSAVHRFFPRSRSRGAPWEDPEVPEFFARENMG